MRLEGVYARSKNTFTSCFCGMPAWTRVLTLMVVVPRFITLSPYALCMFFFWFRHFLCFIIHLEQPYQLMQTFYLFYTQKKKQKNYFFYFTHLFLQNTHSSLSILHIYSIKYSFFYNFLLFPHSLPLSLSNATLSKNTKILNVQATIIVHICTITVSLVHLCTILHPLMWVFFLLKMCKMDYFFVFCKIMHDLMRLLYTLDY